jgi:hypothetical protein
LPPTQEEEEEAEAPAEGVPKAPSPGVILGRLQEAPEPLCLATTSPRMERVTSPSSPSSAAGFRAREIVSRSCQRLKELVAPSSSTQKSIKVVQPARASTLSTANAAAKAKPVNVVRGPRGGAGWKVVQMVAQASSSASRAVRGGVRKKARAETAAGPTAGRKVHMVGGRGGLFSAALTGALTAHAQATSSDGGRKKRKR